MPEALKKLIQNIGLLPGIGEKTATRIALFLMQSNKHFVEDFRKNLQDINDKVSYCENCHALTDKTKKLCQICEKDTREKSLICVVEEYLDMLTIEQAGGYGWVYHILGGAISPLNGVFIADLNFESLFKKIENSDDKIELILATNPNLEGEATTAYIKEEIQKRWLKHKVILTRLSRWLSSWYIEYADNLTLVNAFKDRKEIQ